jgi:hypothetical protein
MYAARRLVAATQFIAHMAMEPSIFAHQIRSQRILRRQPVPARTAHPGAADIRQRGLTKVDLAPDDVRLVEQMGRRFERLLASGKFHRKPDPARSNTKAFGKYLYYFNRGWQDWFPEISLVVESGMGDLLRAFFGRDYSIMGVEVARKCFIDDDSPIRDAYSNFWHFDWRRRDKAWLLVILNLNDQFDDEAFQTFDLQTSASALKNGQHGRYPNDELPEELRRSTINCAGGPAGTCHIAMAADMLHRSGDARPNKNRDVMFVFVEADAPWPDQIGFHSASETKQIASDQSD